MRINSMTLPATEPPITPMSSSLPACRKRRSSITPSLISATSSTDSAMTTPSSSSENLNIRISSIDRGKCNLSSIVLEMNMNPDVHSHDGPHSKKARSESKSAHQKQDVYTPSKSPVNLDCVFHDDDSETFHRPFDPCEMKRHLVQRSVITLKKLPHQAGKTTEAEITENLPSEDAAFALFQGSGHASGLDEKNTSTIAPSTNNSKVIKWQLKGNDEINSWLEKKDEYIHPVESGNWCIWWGAVYNPTYAWAKFDSCEAQFDKQTKNFRLKLRTVLYATGKDENGNPSCIE